MLRGVESQGMILAAEKDGTLDILEVTSAKPGDRAEFVSGTQKEQITFDEFAAFTITTDDSHQVISDGKTLTINNIPVLSKNAPAGSKIR